MMSEKEEITKPVEAPTIATSGPIDYNSTITREEYLRRGENFRTTLDEPISLRSHSALTMGQNISDSRFKFTSLLEKRNLLTPNQAKYLSLQSIANCIGIETNLFYSDDKQDQTVAKKICESCVIKNICLENAIDSNESFGIWGGLTSKERFNEIRRRNYKKSKIK